MHPRKIVTVLWAALNCANVAQTQAINPILSHADPFITLDPVTKDGQYVLTVTGGASGPGVTLWSGSTPATF